MTSRGSTEAERFGTALSAALPDLRRRSRGMTEDRRAQLEHEDTVRALRRRRDKLIGALPARARKWTRQRYEGTYPDAAENFIDSTDPAQWILVVHGPDVGNGKSHVTTAAWLAMGQCFKHGTPLWTSAASLLLGMRRQYDGDWKPTEAARYSPLLHIDDFGRQNTSSADSMAMMSWLLCDRFDNQRKTLVNTNWTEQQVRNWDAGLGDRMFSERFAFVVPMTGDSWR